MTINTDKAKAILSLSVVVSEQILHLFTATQISKAEGELAIAMVAAASAHESREGPERFIELYRATYAAIGAAK